MLYEDVHWGISYYVTHTEKRKKKRWEVLGAPNIFAKSYEQLETTCYSLRNCTEVELNKLYGARRTSVGKAWGWDRL